MTNDAFGDALEIIPLYEPSERFLQAFYEFAARLNGLQRYWEFTRRFVSGYLTNLKAAQTDSSAEMELIKGDVLLSDQEYFPEFLRGAVIAHGLTLLENLLTDVANDISLELKKKPELDQRNLPYVNRYVLFLTRTCGLELEVSTDQWKKLDAIRELRNRYVHKLDRDLPTETKATLDRIAKEAYYDEKPADEAIVDVSLRVVAELAKQVEIAYWRWFETQK